MDHLHAFATALAVALTIPAAAQGREHHEDDVVAADSTAAEWIATALRARAAGKQAELLAVGRRLTALHPDDPAGHFLVATAHASLGPSFSKDVAVDAFARVLALAPPTLKSDAAQRLLDLMPGPKRSTLAALRSTIAGWQDGLVAGKTLLLAPDKTALARASERAARRVEQVATWAAAERDKLARVRKQKKDAERALEREREKSRGPRAGFTDLQPWLDRIASCARTIPVCARRLREHEDDLRALRATAKLLAQRLDELK